jgi:adsorption protein B
MNGLPSLEDGLADVLDLGMRALAYPVCWTILVNGLDDLFIDANYYLRGLYRDSERAITTEELKANEAKRIAMMVPAWAESEVIHKMLELNLEQLDYDNEDYDIFVGTYANDPATQARVDVIARSAKNVHKVVVPHDGPTSKADCLNWVYQQIRLVEEERGQRYDILLMHDAEDIIHPLALRLYSYLIPEHDFVQTPVFPLEMPWHAFVASTYKDEFAEHHLKDMLVREKIGGLVPSAGVGSAFDRDAFEDIAIAHSQEAFNVGSMTEDYEVGMKFRLAGKKVYFACRAIRRVREVERGFFRKRTVRLVEDEYIATREFFPNKLRFAVRQRSRWILGIALQTWEEMGWQGPLPVLYCLWRDRKALFTNLIAVFGYVVAAYCMVRLAHGEITGRIWTFDNIFPPGSVLWWLVMSNTLILAWRSVMKYLKVDEIYGPVHGLLSVPRFFVSNIINFAATCRAISQYVSHKMTGEPLRWLKTEHAFPDAEVLRAYRRRLGDLLRSRVALSESDLKEALELQGRTGLKLGQVLSISGLVAPRAVTEAIAEQFALPLVEPDPYRIPLLLLQRLPEPDATLLRVLPLDLAGEDRAWVAISDPPSAVLTERLEALLGMAVSYCFVPEDKIQRARDQAYRRLVMEAEGRPQRLRLGERLVAAGRITEEQLQVALEEQVRTGERLGELLLRQGLLSAPILAAAIGGARSTPFRSIHPRDVDPRSLARIGYGVAALYRLVPLHPRPGQREVEVVSAAPLHDEVLQLLTARIGYPVEPLLGPSLDIRLGLAVAAREAWPEGIAAGLGGMDGVELAALRAEPDLEPEVASIRDRSIAQGHSPIDSLLADRAISSQRAARLRARSLGIALAEPSEMNAFDDEAWLPPGLVRRGDLELIELGSDQLIVASPHPTARLAREISTLFPDAAIAWRVAPGAESAQDSGDLADGVSQEHPRPGAPGGP